MRYEEVLSEVLEKPKYAIRDTVGVGSYGAHHDVSKPVSAHVDEPSPVTDATVIGRRTASDAGAALANGQFTYTID